MHLVGQLSRPSSRLQAILDPLEAAAAEPSGPSLPGPVKRRVGNGVVQRAIVSVLTEAGEPLPVAAIHAAVERQLGQPVSGESVSWCLRMGSKGEGGRFERMSYGVYRLRKAL